MEREKNVRSTHTATKPINRQIATQYSLRKIHSMNSGSFHDNKRFFFSLLNLAFFSTSSLSFGSCSFLHSVLRKAEFGRVEKTVLGKRYSEIATTREKTERKCDGMLKWSSIKFGAITLTWLQVSGCRIKCARTWPTNKLAIKIQPERKRKAKNWNQFRVEKHSGEKFNEHYSMKPQ